MSATMPRWWRLANIGLDEADRSKLESGLGLFLWEHGIGFEDWRIELEESTADQRPPDFDEWLADRDLDHAWSPAQDGPCDLDDEAHTTWLPL